MRARRERSRCEARTMARRLTRVELAEAGAVLRRVLAAIAAGATHEAAAEAAGVHRVTVSRCTQGGGIPSCLQMARTRPGPTSP